MKRVRKLALALSVILVLVSLLAGCQDQSGASKESDDEKKTEQQTEGSSSADQKVDEGGESQKAPTSMELYQGFLAGEVPVYFDRVDFSYYAYEKDEDVPCFEKNKGYTLKEFIGRVQQLDNMDEYYSVYVDEVWYAFVDCGRDGEPELVVSITNAGDSWNAYSYEYVIKNFDGKLQACHRNSDAYRGQEAMNNDFGVIYEAWYGGMGYYVSYAMLDANCEYHFLYSTDYESMNYACTSYEPLNNAIFDIMDREEDDTLFEGIDLVSYRFQEYEEGEDPLETYFFTYEYYDYESDDNDSECPAELKALVEEAFQTAGVKLYSSAELKDRQEKLLTEAGFTKDEINNWDRSLDWTPMERADFWPGKVSTVKTTAEFMEAIEDNALILLEPGTYDVTKWLVEEGGMEKTPNMEYGDYASENPKGILHTGWEEDSWEVVINDIWNLTIASADPKNPARIVCDCSHALVLNFQKCEFLKLENLIMGHEVVPGSCSGDVVGLYDCNYPKAEGCDLYGCGAHGMNIEGCTNVNLTDCVIHDCTYGCLYIVNSDYVSVNTTRFENCREFDMFAVIDSYLYFSECSFKNLNGNMIYVGGDSFVSFWECQYDAQALQGIQSSKGYGDSIIVY